MSILQVYETNAGSMCESCAQKEPDFGAELSGPFERVDYWPGGYCANCRFTMPADGAPGGRPNEWRGQPRPLEEGSPEWRVAEAQAAIGVHADGREDAVCAERDEEAGFHFEPCPEHDGPSCENCDGSGRVMIFS